MSIEQLISKYGYAAIGIGTFFEGETILIMGGFAAHRGYLELPWVILFALLGTLFGDQLYFYMGRAKGKTALEKRPVWKSKSEKVFSLIEHHQLWLILGFRFLYGVRTVTPFLVGASRIAPLRFLILNIVGATIWAIVIGTMGYFLGHALELIIGEIKHYELLILVILAGVGIVVWSAHLLSKKRVSAKKSAQPTPKSSAADR